MVPTFVNMSISLCVIYRLRRQGKEGIATRARSPSKESIAHRWHIFFFNLALFERLFAYVLTYNLGRLLSRLQRASSASHKFRPSRIFHHEESDQSHAHR